jgi:hypothetical protein
VRILKLWCYKVHFYLCSDFVMNWTICGSISNRAKRYFWSPQCSGSILGPSSHLFHEYRGSFLAVKRPGREFDHFFPSSSEVRNEWNCPYVLPLYIRRTSCTFHCYLRLQLTSTTFRYTVCYVYPVSVLDERIATFIVCFILHRLKRR